jgi:hypothetical protein
MTGLLVNLLEFHRKSDGANSKKIPGCNSDKKLIFGKKKVAILASTEPIQFIINASEVLGSS